MGSELIHYRGYRYSLRLRRDYDVNWPSWSADERQSAVENGRKMFDAAHLDLWERNAELVARVQEFLGDAFPWHSARNARDTLEELARSVWQGAVYVIQEKIPSPGGYIPPAQRKAQWPGAVEESASDMSFKERYLAQLERIDAERPSWEQTEALLDDINASFMARMTSASPLFDAMFEAAGWRDKYADTPGAAPSRLTDAQPFDYGDAFTLPAGDSQLAWLPRTGGPADTWVANPSGSGQLRLYDSSGNAAVDIDFDHDHGFGSPHAHNWDGNSRDKGNAFSLLPY